MFATEGHNHRIRKEALITSLDDRCTRDTTYDFIKDEMYVEGTDLQARDLSPITYPIRYWELSRVGVYPPNGEYYVSPLAIFSY